VVWVSPITTHVLTHTHIHTHHTHKHIDTHTHTYSSTVIISLPIIMAICRFSFFSGALSGIVPGIPPCLALAPSPSHPPETYVLCRQLGSGSPFSPAIQSSALPNPTLPSCMGPVLCLVSGLWLWDASSTTGGPGLHPPVADSSRVRRSGPSSRKNS
jgi:hypothetical protein